MSQSGIQIGDLAKRAGVTIDTVRFYERRRLLPRAPRSGGGFLLFGPEVVDIVGLTGSIQSREPQSIGK